jgi:hypothetical protein
MAFSIDEIHENSSQQEVSRRARVRNRRITAATNFLLARHSQRDVEDVKRKDKRERTNTMQNIAIYSELTEIELDLVTGGEDKKAAAPAQTQKPAENKGNEGSKGKTETETKLAASLKAAAEVKGGEKTYSASGEITFSKTWTRK